MTKENADGLKSWCKTCLCLYEKERRIKCGSEIRRRDRERRENNLENRKEQERRADEKRRLKPDHHRIQRAKLYDFSLAKHKEAGKVSTCCICGVTYCNLYSKAIWVKTCSEKCSDDLYRKLVRRKTSTYRARKRMAVREVFDPFDVFTRDKWHCQFCNIKTPKKLRGTYHPSAPELDHIIPLSKGGEHSMRNTQCLCRQCNIEKGAQEKGQLRMFG